MTFLHILVILFSKCPLGLGGPIVVDHAFDVARGHRTESQRSEIAKKGHRHSRLIPVRVGEHHAGPVCLRLQNRAEQRVHLGIHHDHMLAMVERVQHHMGCSLNSARHFHEYVDGIAAGQHERIVGQDGEPSGNGRLCLTSRSCATPFRHTGFPERPFTMLWRSIRNRYEANSRCWCSELQGDGAPRGAGPNHADADRMTRGFTFLKGCINDHLVLISCRFISGQRRSCSETAVATNGH